MSKVRLIVGAGVASPSPPVGPALGSRGVKAMDFCREFNARTGQYVQGIPIPTEIFVTPDRKFTFTTRTPPTVWLLQRAAGISKGASKPGVEEKVGKVSVKHIYEIAKIKARDEMMAGLEVSSIAKSVIATAKSAGIEVAY